MTGQSATAPSIAAAIAVIAIALAGCNTAITPEQSAAATAQLACFKREAARLDDGFSDPFAIGMAVTSACYVEEERAVDSLSAWQSYENTERIRYRLERADLKLAVEAVLLHRRDMHGG